MSEPKKKPGVAFWATVVVVVALVLYPLSVGPAAWMRVHVLPKSTRKPMDAFYWPLAVINRYVPAVNGLTLRYIGLWVSLEDFANTPTDP